MCGGAPSAPAPPPRLPEAPQPPPMTRTTGVGPMMSAAARVVPNATFRSIVGKPDVNFKSTSLGSSARDRSTILGG